MLVFVRVRRVRRSRGCWCRPRWARKSSTSRCDQSCLLRSLHFPVYRWVRCTRQLGDLGEAQLTVGIAEQQRKDLALLLGAQDGQERWRWHSVHKVKSTLRFVIMLATLQVPGGLAGATSITAQGSPAWIYTGRDERGRELEVIAVEIEQSEGRDPFLLVIHIMPATSLRKENRDA